MPSLSPPRQGRDRFVGLPVLEVILTQLSVWMTLLRRFHLLSPADPSDQAQPGKKHDIGLALGYDLGGDDDLTRVINVRGTS